MPRSVVGLVMGLVNAVGNIGGWAGHYAFGWLKQETGGTGVPFSALGAGRLRAAAFTYSESSLRYTVLGTWPLSLKSLMISSRPGR